MKLALLFLLFFQTHSLTERQAVQLAEDFVKQNGYTSERVNRQNLKLSYELTDQWSESRDGRHHEDSVLKRRYNMLEARASYISTDADGTYHVGFRYSGDTANGRAVKVHQDGSAVMAHKPPFFARFKRLK